MAVYCTCETIKDLPNMALFYDERSDHGVRASAVRSLADLPEEVLLLVMERVPLLARLRSCSLVCRSMHKAAAAVTLSIKVPSCRPTAAASADRSALQLYLQKYGHQLTSISLQQEELCFQDQSLQETAADGRQQQKLLTLQPCSQLQELVLSGGRLQPAVLHAPAATLTKLVLQSSVHLVKSPTAGQLDPVTVRYYHGWDNMPGVLEDEWSEGSESDADSADDLSESDDEDPSNGPAASTAPLGRRFHKAWLHLSGLKHLQLDYCSGGSQTTRFGKALPYLTHLTHLKLWWQCVDFKPWRQHLSCLTDLRVLALYTDREQSQDLVQELDQHSLLADEVLEGVQHLQRLTELQVEGLCLAVTAHSSSTLGRLTGLQVLQLSYASCDLSALAAITGLRSLSLQHIEPSLKDGPDHFWRPEPQPVSKQQLQAALLQQQHLTCFKIQAQLWRCDSPCTLEAVDDTWELPPAPWSHYYLPTGCEDEDKACEDAEQSNAVESGSSFKPQPGMEVFAAFTASSCLQHLDLSNAVLQFHSWQHMFPAGRTLLQLTCLKAPHALYYPDQFEDPAESDLALTDADVEAMVSCCPALQALDAGNVLHLSDKPNLSRLQHLTMLHAMWGGLYFEAWDEDGDGDYMDVWQRVDQVAAARELSKLANLRQLKLRGGGQWGECLFRALQQLSHLTNLCLSGNYRGRLTDGEASLIARLTGLQELDVQDCCQLQEAHLLQLASLPQLTRLCFKPAADMSTVFAQAVKSFKQIPEGVCIIESKECFGEPCDILHQLLQKLLKVYQQQETTLAKMEVSAAQQQRRLQENNHQLAQLTQQLSSTKSLAEQLQRKHDTAVEGALGLLAAQQKQLQEKDQQFAQLCQQLASSKAAAEQQKRQDDAALVLQHNELCKAQQLIQQQQQHLEQQRLQLEQQQQQLAQKQQCLDMQQLQMKHTQQERQQQLGTHQQQLREQQRVAEQQAESVQQQNLAVQQQLQVQLTQKDDVIARQQQELARLRQLTTQMSRHQQQPPPWQQQPPPPPPGQQQQQPPPPPPGQQQPPSPWRQQHPTPWQQQQQPISWQQQQQQLQQPGCYGYNTW